jgi:hypothetical protein
MADYLTPPTSGRNERSLARNQLIETLDTRGRLAFVTIDGKQFIQRETVMEELLNRIEKMEANILAAISAQPRSGGRRGASASAAPADVKTDQFTIAKVYVDPYDWGTKYNVQLAGSVKVGTTDKTLGEKAVSLEGQPAIVTFGKVTRKGRDYFDLIDIKPCF